MNKMLVPLFLPLLLLMLEVITPVTPAIVHSVQVTSFNEAKKQQNGEVRCALDPANETISSSSLQDCSHNCALDATCAGFNIKNSLTCELYNYKPKITALVSSCALYQVATISSLLLHT